MTDSKEVNGTIYLIYDINNDLFKIGLTRGSVRKRLKQLQTGNGTELKIIKSYDTKYPILLEQHLHLKFCGKNALNEWFYLNDDDVFGFEKTCETIEQSLLILETNDFMTKRLK